MKLSKKTLILVSLGFFTTGISICCFILLSAKPDFPEYNGKTVDEWFYGEDGHPGRQKTMEAAKVAYANMGTNCVPYLIGRLKTADTVWTRIYGMVFPKLPIELQRKLTPPFDSIYVDFIAISHLSNLYINSLDPFAMELIEVLKPKKSNKHGSSAFHLLKKLAIRLDDKTEKTSILCDLLDFQDFDQRLQTAILLSKIDPGITNGIPILLNAVTNRSEVKATFSQLNNNMLRKFSRIEEMVTKKQEEALETLQLVAPDIAESYTPNISLIE